MGNQRRSRARRKEYLQELEIRLRQCELQGVEASSEIQGAARKVAEENKRLRALLSQQGVREDSIQHAGKAASMQYITPSSSATSETGSSHGISHHQSLVPAQMGRNLSPAWNTSSQNPRIFEDQPFSMSHQPYPSLQSNIPKHQYPSVQQSSMYVPTTSNMNDCNYAAEMITTMSGVSDSL